MNRQCCECGRVIPLVKGVARCTPCYQRYQRKRNSAKAVRYDQDHKATRAHWVPLVATGMVRCARCQQLITGTWDLDHLPNGTTYPSHPACNSAASRGGRGE